MQKSINIEMMKAVLLRYIVIVLSIFKKKLNEYSSISKKR